MLKKLLALLSQSLTIALLTKISLRNDNDRVHANILFQPIKTILEKRKEKLKSVMRYLS